ncbi:hypothetical protein Lalb_Chr06g0161611 [Lupinus albus]|uniref:Uncharacterized protein n=1 Tax=Lupinus albus TaxID=3870 RepID=A0A6A4QCL8_LUPAL|nr:hypothetical protein Lalb_Chr06g0161611 [Lupinus albus]
MEGKFKLLHYFNFISAQYACIKLLSMVWLAEFQALLFGYARFSNSFITLAYFSI